MAVSDAAEVLMEDDIEDPVEAILDAPMAADGAGEERGIGRQAGEEVARFARDSVADPSSGLDADDAAEAGPATVGVDVGEVLWIADREAAAGLGAPMGALVRHGRPEVGQGEGRPGRRRDVGKRQ